ncbi:hypothetical protein [Streptomyces echinatus]|uniref:Uncharacterized protein n=1 Tax=Streptomyces echinatus TaxID=67293 RepID=A0A7W9PQV6_9ACTN|nr:hypothetical protein [Streptomyces echinatus]
MTPDAVVLGFGVLGAAEAAGAGAAGAVVALGALGALGVLGAAFPWGRWAGTFFLALG